jgi:hypothetical protein
MEQAVEETTFSFSSETPRPPERRQNQRHLTILRVGTVIVGDRRELCLIRNISAGGLMAHVYSQLRLEEQVAIELKTNQRIDGSISWIEGSNVGISFDEQIDVEEILASQSSMENGWRPRLPRVEVDRLATMRVGAHVYGVSIRDISQGGVKLETDQPVEAGADIVLTLDKLASVQGVTRWYGSGLCGISFNQVIPFRDLMGWLRAQA